MVVKAKRKLVNALYINDIRREYAIYVLTSRAIPSVCDGMKAAARRVMWMARDGHTYKSASLAGATMPIHPHAPAESTIDTIAAPYGNNYPLLTGIGSFGTFLKPDAYGASRYTNVKISQFSKDVVLTDIDIIPMTENYDGTLQEPVHFLPLVPIVLLNPAHGIAIGFASTILPRTLSDVVNAQLAYLSNKTIEPIISTFLPTKQKAIFENGKWVFKGTINRVGATTVRIVALPYGTTHADVVTNEKSKLNSLIEAGTIVDYVDGSKKSTNVLVTFKRGDLAKLTDDQLLKMFGLITNANENLTVMNFNNQAILGDVTDIDIIRKFTDWRLTWYVKRYQHLMMLLDHDISKYTDIIKAIDNDAGKVAVIKKDKKEYCDWLASISIVNVDYIAALPTYRYTLDERSKVEKLLAQALKNKMEYQSIIDTPAKQKAIYKKELEEVIAKHGKADAI
jgi:DNA gyrase subunit A